MADMEAAASTALSDPTFCAKLIENPEAALAQFGVEATPEMIAELKSLDADSVRQLAETYGKQQAAAA